MPLTGELEHLPIVDVIQLIHSTRKTGTLQVFSRGGEGQLVFNNGYIVGATHSNEELRIGKILRECELISEEALNKALQVQEDAGEERRPLIATLLEHCGMQKKAAFKALETLIEMTIVEMISWSVGFFSFEVDQIEIFDEYRYLPTQLQELSLDTQMVLMDALRIFDEKVHAGEIQIIDEPLEEMPNLQQPEEKEEETESISDEQIIVSEDILGLADLDKVERKKPHVFKSLEAFDPATMHRQTIVKSFPGLNDSQINELTAFLSESGNRINTLDSRQMAPNQALILFSEDQFLQHAVMTVCKTDRMLVFTTAADDELDDQIERARNRDLSIVLVIDALTDSDSFNPEKLEKFWAEKAALLSGTPVVQLSANNDNNFTYRALQSGIRSVLPKPSQPGQRQDFTADMIQFLKTLHSYVLGCTGNRDKGHFGRMREGLKNLKGLSKAPEISLSVLEFIGSIFERSQTLIVDKGELLAERSIGVVSDKSEGVAAAQKFRFPIEEDSIFQEVMNSHSPFYGPIKNSSLGQHLYPQIGAPLESTVLLAPLKCNDKTITITYADFGNTKSRQIPIDFIEFFIDQAGIAMENALFRRQLGKVSKPQ